MSKAPKRTTKPEPITPADFIAGMAALGHSLYAVTFRGKRQPGFTEYWDGDQSKEYERARKRLTLRLFWSGADAREQIARNLYAVGLRERLDISGRPAKASRRKMQAAVRHAVRNVTRAKGGAT